MPSLQQSLFTVSFAKTATAHPCCTLLVCRGGQKQVGKRVAPGGQRKKKLQRWTIPFDLSGGALPFPPAPCQVAADEQLKHRQQCTCGRENPCVIGNQPRRSRQRFVQLYSPCVGAPDRESPANNEKARGSSCILIPPKTCLLQLALFRNQLVHAYMHTGASSPPSGFGPQSQPPRPQSTQSLS